MAYGHKGLCSVLNIYALFEYNDFLISILCALKKF